MSSIKQWQVGETFTYPSMTEWNFVTKLPETAAWEWLKQAVPGAEISGYRNVTVASILSGEDESYGWLNKVAVIVSVDVSRVVALYKHDSSFWVIRQQQHL